MTTAMKKTTAASASSNGDRRFPPEVYSYDDDVTSEAVDILREKARKTMTSDEWEIVDGFGLAAPS